MRAVVIAGVDPSEGKAGGVDPLVFSTAKESGKAAAALTTLEVGAQAVGKAPGVEDPGLYDENGVLMFSGAVLRPGWWYLDPASGGVIWRNEQGFAIRDYVPNPDYTGIFGTQGPQPITPNGLPGGIAPSNYVHLDRRAVLQEGTNAAAAFAYPEDAPRPLGVYSLSPYSGKVYALGGDADFSERFAGYQDGGYCFPYGTWPASFVQARGLPSSKRWFFLPPYLGSYQRWKPLLFLPTAAQLADMALGYVNPGYPVLVEEKDFEVLGPTKDGRGQVVRPILKRKRPGGARPVAVNGIGSRSFPLSPLAVPGGLAGIGEVTDDGSQYGGGASDNGPGDTSGGGTSNNAGAWVDAAGVLLEYGMEIYQSSQGNNTAVYDQSNVPPLTEGQALMGVMSSVDSFEDGEYTTGALNAALTIGTYLQSKKALDPKFPWGKMCAAMASGAAVGASIGSALTPVATVIGAVIGAVVAAVAFVISFFTQRANDNIVSGVAYAPGVAAWMATFGPEAFFQWLKDTSQEGVLNSKVDDVQMSFLAWTVQTWGVVLDPAERLYGGMMNGAILSPYAWEGQLWSAAYPDPTHQPSEADRDELRNAPRSTYEGASWVRHAYTSFGISMEASIAARREGNTGRGFCYLRSQAVITNAEAAGGGWFGGPGGSGGGGALFAVGLVALLALKK